MKKYCLFTILLITSVLGFANPQPAKDVFKLKATALDSTTLILDWQIKKGYFLYQKKINISNKPESNIHLGKIILPAATTKTTAQGQRIEIFRDALSLTVPVLGEKPGETTLNVYFQGCSDEGFCYPPQQNNIQLTIDSKLALIDASMENQALPAATKHPSQRSELEQLFSNCNWGFIILSFFGFGLLLAFTPCVLPMIPVLSGIIVGHGADLTTRKAFFLSLSYVLSMSVTYSLIGAVIAFMGNNLQIAMQSTWAIGLFSLLFILLALSMFDVYELRLPVSFQSKIANITRSQSGGHYISAAIMGCLSILILSPCVTAPLIGALGYIAHEGSISLGILSLFFLGLGMGTPLLLIGTSAGKLLPRAGQWMNEVKSFFGVMLLAVAIYLLSRLLPAVVTMTLWACLLIFSGIFLGALSKAKSHLEKFNQGAGLILMVYGFLILMGASEGHNNPILPLKQELSSSRLVNTEHKITVTTLDDAQTVLTRAKSEGNAVFMDFYADWCTSCKDIAATTLQNPHVEMALDKFVVLTVDLSANNAQSHELLTYFKVVAPPAFLFFNAQGHELDELRIVGHVSSDTLLKKLASASR